MLNKYAENTSFHVSNPDDGMVIHEMIEAQAVKSPDAFAVICGEVCVTYAELNLRANQLAHYLRNFGVQPELLIGICVSRSVDMVVGILGILKAGGAYVPLDPSYPRQRLEFILEDARARLVVTQSDMAGLFSNLDADMILVDRDQQKIQDQPIENPQKINSPDGLAYMIYTSGSTGNPKGVMITHASLCNFVRVARSALGVSQQDRYLQNASIGYALSVRQLMVSLTSGATIVLATTEETRDPFELFRLVKKENITLMDVVPSFWRTSIQRLLDLESGERKDLLENHLRRVVSIGEPLLSDIPHDWRFKLQHPAELVNIFGQTETTGVVAAYPIHPDPRKTDQGTVPVGRPVADTYLYILDADLQPVQPGEAGELCVSSPCLARGYLNQPELTLAKFISNPFEDGASDRLYRTGDMARYREDGNIQFLGRSDHQVKIRGQRLELGEVELTLREFPGVLDCVVVAREDQPDAKYLVAYVIFSSRPSTASLREFMRERVPEYMLPSHFVFLKSFPLTPNGKVNRLALLDPRLIEQDADAPAPAQPRNDIERKLSIIWGDLLKQNQIGIHDNFFDIGGDSFMAVRLFSRIERELCIRLPLTTLFHAATIAQLSAIFERKNEPLEIWSPVVPINTNGEKPLFFGVHGHEGGVLFWRDVVLSLPADQPFYAIQAQGVDGYQPALTSIEGMSAFYISEMRKVQLHGPYYLGGFSMGGVIAFEMGRQLVVQGEQVNLLVMLDTRNPENVDGSVPQEMDAGARSKSVQPHLDWHPGVGRRFLRFAGMSVREKVIYIVHNIRYHARRIALFMLADLLRKSGRRLPGSLLSPYLRMSHSQALRKYVPKAYPGNITIFRSSESAGANSDNSAEGWGLLSGGRLDVYHFKATHNLVNVEYAEDVARTLSECLAKARGF